MSVIMSPFHLETFLSKFAIMENTVDLSLMALFKAAFFQSVSYLILGKAKKILKQQQKNLRREQSEQRLCIWKQPDD